ncbi:hypothetical protein E4U43_007150 [Claviceps pusilla]|uniref:Cytochrome P450 n=1 Tax=Claviceps pusilla TaxID=123648 RepID=A0A9P7NCY4_9HYPO|nr:hypothetical protein E4U43_007150 [Claviceps pusilla]
MDMALGLPHLLPYLSVMVGLISNIINLISWAICHIIANPGLETSPREELEEASSGDSNRDSRGALGPWHGLDVPTVRRLNKDGLFGEDIELKKGSVIVSPIHPSDIFDATIWGGDAHVFRPGRFIHTRGSRRINRELAKHLPVFGLPGMHQCPGRYLGLTMGADRADPSHGPSGDTAQARRWLGEGTGAGS